MGSWSLMEQIKPDFPFSRLALPASELDGQFTFALDVIGSQLDYDVTLKSVNLVYSYISNIKVEDRFLLGLQSLAMLILTPTGSVKDADFQ